MSQPIIGVSIQAGSAAEAVAQVRQAENAGVQAAWATIGVAGGADAITTFAAALTQTERILLGTSIVQTWPRHPITFAQEVVALESLAPGRFRLGIGPGHELMMAPTYGVRWEAPLTNLREYLTVLRALLHEGEVDFEGRHVTARSRVRTPTQTPIMASALRPRSFELCGELADGAISWMCPWPYLVEQALPALRRGAEQAGREAPPLVAHVPIAVSEDREAVYALARDQLSGYARIPFYRAMFLKAGYADVGEGGYSDELLANLVVHGTEDEVVAGLVALIEMGMGEVLAAPLIEPEDRDGSLARAFAAVARAGAALSG